MAGIRIYEEQLRAPDGTVKVAVAGGQAEAAIARGLADGANVLDRAGALAAQRDLAQQKAVRTQRLSETRVKALSDLTDLKIKYANDPDPATMRDRWQADTDALLKSYQEGFGEDRGLSQVFTTDFEEWRLRDRVDIAGAASKKIGERGRAQLDAGLDTLAGMLARTDDPIRRQQIEDMASVSLQDGVTAGYLDAVEAGNLGRKFLGRADEVKLRGLIIDDPEAALQALNDPDQFANIDEVQRTQLMDTATRRVDSLRSDRIRLAEKAERDAAKALELQRDEIEKSLLARDADGTLTRDDVEAARPDLTPTAYKAMLAALDPETPDVVEDPALLADLFVGVADRDIAAEATDAFKAGRIKKETFTTLLTQNRQMRAGNAPETPYKSARALVSTTLDPGQLLSGPAASIARSGQAQALVEFDNWAAAHPQATRSEAQEEAQNTIRRYQVINYEQMSLATGLPRYFAGTRDALSFADLDAAEARVLAELDGGGMSRAQADQELRKIEGWRAILNAKPDKGTSQ